MKLATHPAQAAASRSASSSGTSGRAWTLRGLLGGRRAPLSAVASSVRALSVMVTARLPVVDALEATAAQAADRRVSDALAEAGRSVRRGMGLADALSRQEEVVGPLLPQVARVGEASGTLGPALVRLADYLEKTDALRRKVRLALVYPGIVLGVAAGAVAFLLTVVVPTFAELFADFDAALPMPTQVVIALSEFLRSNALLLTLLTIGLVVGARSLVRSERGGLWWDTTRLRIPVFGSLSRKALAARLGRTLSTLLSSGVPLVDALAVAAGGMENRAVEAAFRLARSKVVRGAALSGPLGASGLLPPLFVQMAGVGEQTGELASVLDHTAAHFEREVDAAVEGLTSVIEPVLILALGIVVGGILVAIYLPMFDLVTVLE